MERLRTILKLMLLLLMGAVLVWQGAFVQAHKLQVEYTDTALLQWPADAKPVRIALLGDIHATYRDAAWLDYVVRKTLEQKPEAVILLGDYCFTTGKQLFTMSPQEVAGHLAPLAQHCPVYYVMGNHDGFPELAVLGAELRKAGFIPLDRRRDRVHMFSNGQGVRLRGAPFVPEDEDEKRLRPRFNPLKTAYRGRPLVTVAHNPYHFLRWKLAGDLILCGHTHGGQICAHSGSPFLPADKFPPAWQHGGWHRAASGSPLYITRGIGMTKLPMRLNCPPELTILELHG